MQPYVSETNRATSYFFCYDKYDSPQKYARDL